MKRRWRRRYARCTQFSQKRPATWGGTGSSMRGRRRLSCWEMPPRMQTTAPAGRRPSLTLERNAPVPWLTSMTRARLAGPVDGVVETPMSETLQQATRRPKASCHGWLDSLFSDLYTDLSALDAWEFEEAALTDGTGALAAPTPGGGGAEKLSAAVTVTLPAMLSKEAGTLFASVANTSTSSEARDIAGGDSASNLWMERAKLAERLLRAGSARKAYTRAIQALEELLDGGPSHPPMQGSEREEADALWTGGATDALAL